MYKPKFAPRNVLQFKAHDQHNHYFIQILRRLGIPFRTEVLPASDLSFASASPEDYSTEEGLRAVTPTHEQ
jgi:hypothetical protein